ncbi:Autophagy-related protein [Trichinella spiralis]|uniref:Autophagy-related protein n=1 Tax=Trichinella spiralis TaxID=6334 RepID=A0ABR3KYY3_TRISP
MTRDDLARLFDVADERALSKERNSSGGVVKELAESLCLSVSSTCKQAAVSVFHCRLCVSALALDHESVRPAICLVRLRGIDPLEWRDQLASCIGRCASVVKRASALLCRACFRHFGKLCEPMSTAPLESRLSIAETVSREMGALDAQVGETDTKPVRPSHIDIKESAAKLLGFAVVSARCLTLFDFTSVSANALQSIDFLVIVRSFVQRLSNAIGR